MAFSKHLALACVFLAALLAVPSAAEACSCVGGIPLCESFWKTPVVFSGEVTAITNADPADPSRLLSRRRVHFRIDRTYRGDVKGEVDVYTGLGGGDCGFNFMQGQKYLVFANAFEGRLSTGICNPTKRLAEAASELAYLENPSTAPESGRLFGEARFWDRDGGSPAAHQKVVVRGGSREWTATTDASGKFDVASLPAGKYQVELLAPKGWSARGPLTIEMPDARACARVDFFLQSAGRVHLKVLDPSGQPRTSIPLELIEASSLVDAAPRAEYTVGLSVATGDVVWEHVPPGRYVIGLNVTRGPDLESRFLTTFYPGVQDHAAAKVIEVKLGERVELPAFRLPDAQPMIAVRGSVVLPTARNVGGASMALLSDAPHSRGRVVSTAKTDYAGRFALNGVAGWRYRVRAFVNGKTISSEPFELTPATAPLLIVVR